MSASLAALDAWAAGIGAAAAEVAVERPADRQAATAAGRRAAGAALARLGGPPMSLERHPDGRPVWPTGWTGSISHTSAVAVAVVRASATGGAVGVDLEAAGGLTFDDATLVLGDDELAWARGRPDADAAVTLVWSAKEAAFKAWNEAAAGALPPVDPQRHLAVTIGADGTVTVRATHELAPATTGPVQGRWWSLGPHVLVAVHL